MKSKIKFLMLAITMSLLLLNSAFSTLNCSRWNDMKDACSGQVGCYYDKDCGCKATRTIPPTCGSFCCATGFTSSGSTLTQSAGYFYYTCSANQVSQINSTNTMPPNGCQNLFTAYNWSANLVDSVNKKYNYKYWCKISDGGLLPE